MYQQINLYQPVFRQEEKIFSSRTLLIIWALVVVLLLGLYGSHRIELHQQQQTLQQVEAQRDRLQQQLAQLMASTDQSESERITAEIDQLQQNRDTLESLLATLQGSSLPTASGFSALLRGLAEQRLAGIWLTGIEISAQGAIRLSGRATEERLVPRYLQQLRQHPRLAQEHFSQIQLSVDDNSQQVAFVLQSGGAAL